jgi:glycosyltransferase involved in cell wall biosynthesis
MNWQTDCAAVIPCFNEEAGVVTVIRELQHHVHCVLVVDDGSSDGTTAVARSAGADVVSHSSRRGKGAALRTAWRTAREIGVRWALSLDGDGQHWPGDAPAFFKRAQETGARLVIGNRMHQAAKMPLVRRLVNRYMSASLSRLCRQELPDTQCGFRLLELDAWVQLELQADHFEVESELVVAFARARFKVEFVPIRVIYRGERSKVNPVIDTVRWLRWRIDQAKRTQQIISLINTRSNHFMGADGGHRS